MFQLLSTFSGHMKVKWVVVINPPSSISVMGRRPTIHFLYSSLNHIDSLKSFTATASSLIHIWRPLTCSKVFEKCRVVCWSIFNSRWEQHSSGKIKEIKSSLSIAVSTVQPKFFKTLELIN